MSTKALVLIAEDSEDDFVLLERAFRRADLQVELEWVKDGSEAQEYLARATTKDLVDAPRPPSLILADLKMPRMNGFELLDWIRSQPLLKRIPCVVLTSSNEMLDINRAYEMGANSYLVKPSSFDDLMRMSQSLKSYWLTINQQPEVSPG